VANHLAPLLLAAALSAAPLLAEEPSLPFSMPVPEGWRTETIPFPLGFAPELPYTGLEELRFAPGMFEEGSDELWSYAFVWWIGESEPTDAASLSTHLEEYFRGLAHAVAESRDVQVGDATFGAVIEDNESSGFGGHAETFDAFVTQGQIRLNIEGERLDCPDQGRQAVLFALSPRAPHEPEWKTLRSVLEGFRCSAAQAPEALP